jgi:hypothetical protein
VSRSCLIQPTLRSSEILMALPLSAPANAPNVAIATM